MRKRKVAPPTQAALPGGGHVEVVRIDDAARLITFHEGTDLDPEFVRAAIVKVVPRAESTGPERLELKQRLLSYGASHVWFAPRAAGVEVIAPEELPEEPEEPPRAVIMRMVEEAHTKDRDRLRAVVEAAITPEAM